MSRGWRDESGGATVLACFALAGLVAVTAVLLHLGGAVAARHRAQAAADLGALAAAQALAEGSESACAAAESVARRMRVAVGECSVEGWDVVVSTEAPTGSKALQLGPARAVARAGPAE
ncbi:Rv3654c family TadE-like protein [Rhodococcus sp. SGAir0479]|uniref:Rv3654c family TadE-like protein n=1 Tax=Rhodococcus sp. SGAir0479 TaxID=2567884 RepID=UPI0010CD01E6|nr:Rv3654c family TadE-like protein [Rhodococcus sp. SGAir0479]QCQ93494.1 pilus assembly protein TadE [Rhodococcus sp. SGAir0479]